MESSFPDISNDIKLVREGSYASAEYPAKHLGRPDVSANLFKWGHAQVLNYTSEIERKFSLLKEHVSKLQRELEQSRKEQLALKTELTEKENTIKILQIQVSDSTERNKGYVNNLSKQLTEKAAEVERNQGYMNNLSKQLTEKAAEVERNQGYVNNLSKQLTEKAAEVERNQGYVNNLSKQLTEKNKELERVIVQKSEQEERARKLERGLIEKNEEVERKDHKIHFLKILLNSYHSHNEELNDKLYSNKEYLRSAVWKCGEAEKEASKWEKEASKWEKEASKWEKEADILQKKKKEFQMTALSCENYIQLLESKLSEKNGELEEVRKARDQWKKEVDECKKGHDELPAVKRESIKQETTSNLEINKTTTTSTLASSTKTSQTGEERERKIPSWQRLAMTSSPTKSEEIKENEGETNVHLHVEKLAKPVRTTNVAASLEKNEAGSTAQQKEGGPSGVIHSYELLIKAPFPEGVDPAKREQYLSYSEFERIFKITHQEFETMPKWKQIEEKKKVKLF